MKRLVLLCFLSTSFCFPQQDYFNQLDALLDHLSSNNKMMGSLSIMKDGKTIYNKSIGYQYITANKKKKASKETKYRIGSITKVFTAIMMFQLIDEQKISLEDKLSQFHPEIPNASKITIANLLNHSSGLFNITKDPEASEWTLEPTTQEQMLQRIEKHPPDFQPGKKNEYSNTNFILLGYILEAIEKEPYREILQERIVNKLNLQNTYFGNTIDTTTGESLSYFYKNDTLVPGTETHLSNPGGAGAIVSNPSDLITFVNALFNSKLMSSSSFKTMTTTEGEYGSGILKGEKYGQTIFAHNGSIDGFEFLIIYLPETKTALAITANAANYALMPVLFNALNAVNGKSIAIPNFNENQLTEQQVKKYEGQCENEELPFNLIFVADNQTLKAGMDQNDLNDLKAIKKDEFSLDAMGLTVKFNLQNNTLLLHDQSGTPKLFTKILTNQIPSE